MSLKFQLYTVQLARSKKMDESIHLLDTTAKSGVKEFAPLFSNVMRYKEGTMSMEQYTDAYLRKMRDSKQQNPQVWKELLKHQKVAIACYCKPGQFCHRHLFARLMRDYLMASGHEVEMMGELNGVPYILPAMNMVTPEIQTPPVVINKRDNITPFYGKEHPLSNHHEAGFTIKGVYFKWTEQFLMYCKAKAFKDEIIAEKILEAKSPQICQALGKQVKNYNEATWRILRRKMAFLGNLQKANENPHVKEYLLNTGNNILVEASPYNRIWGVGIAVDDPRIYDVDLWEGSNLQGESWMAVRKRLQEDVIF